ncbi:MAG: nitronate monooxygenase [Gaiellaceae bacterium]
MGFLAAGYRSAEELRGALGELRGLTSAAFGVNVFVPATAEIDEDALAAYGQRLCPGAGAPRADDDDWEAKLALLHEEPVPVVSFTFGCPPAATIASLRAAGSEVWATVTAVEEGHLAATACADVLVLQGSEAGGHRGSFVDRDGEGLSVLALLRLVAGELDLPLVAAGGIADGPAVAAVLALGASAAQIGTAFLRAPEAGTNSAHRDALTQATPTALTRAFSGRLARGLVNRFLEEHQGAPRAYPQIHYATAPLRAAARERGDADGFNLWAGQTHRLARELPAGEIVRTLVDDARVALARAAAALERPAG